MPRKYIKKNTEASSKRGQWSAESLKEAIQRINANEIGMNEASRYYGIPQRTLRRRRSSGNLEKIALGPQSLFGIQNEKRLVKHIQRLESSGFAPDRRTVRRLAYQFAEKLKIKHGFNRETECAGRDWLVSFMERNRELSIRQAEGLSLAPAQGMNRGNNKPGKVIATKGAKDVHVLTSSERGENVTVIACCNAEGTFLPPVLIMKGKRQKPEFSDGLPPGSKVYMNEKSSYINSELFLKWLREHFLPRKAPGKVLLILDGHVSHSNALGMLEFADANDIILLCLPSHTTQALQPLDRSFFKPLNDWFKQAATKWMLHHEDRKVARLQAGLLIGEAWVKAAICNTGISGFKATGIYQLDRTVIPDHFFAISGTSERIDDFGQHNFEPKLESDSETEPTAGPSEIPTGSGSKRVSSATSKSQDEPKSPSEYLTEICAIPKIPLPLNKRRKQSAALLITPAAIDDKRAKLAGKENKNTGNQPAKEKGAPKIKIEKETDNKKKRKRTPDESASDEQSAKGAPKIKIEKETDNKKKSKRTPDESASDKQSTHSISDYEDHCIECSENYRDTRQKVDWVQCTACEEWMHETCTMYGIKCIACGKQEKRARISKMR